MITFTDFELDIYKTLIDQEKEPVSRFTSMALCSFGCNSKILLP